MNIIICALIFCIASYCYYKGQVPVLLVCFYALATDVFSLIDTSSGAKATDFLTLLSLGVLSCEVYKNGWNYLSLKKDKLGIAIFAAFIYFTLEFAGSVALSAETPSFALKVYRPFLLLLPYFYIRKLSFSQLKEFWKLIYIPSVVQGILFYLQLLGITGILHGYISEEGSYLRYGNFPDMAIAFFLYYLFGKHKIRSLQAMNLLFWGMMPIVGMMRGIIIATSAGIFVYMLLHWQRKYVTYLCVAALAYLLVVLPMFSIRNDASTASTTEDISNGVNIDDFAAAESGAGTFTFRMAMLTERWLYLYDNPRNMPFGVGTIHEESPNNNFQFIIGTVNENYPSGRCAIESGDITWVPILLRFGLAGVIVCLAIFTIWFASAFQTQQLTGNTLAIVFATMPIITFLLSFNGSLFDKASSLYLMTFNIGCLTIIQSRYIRLRKVINVVRKYFSTRKAKCNV